MAFQSNINNGSAVATLTCTFTNAQTAGHTNVVCVVGDNFATMTPVTCSDSVNGSYGAAVKTVTNTDGKGIMALFVLENIASAGAGSNVVTVTYASASNDTPMVVAIAEKAAATGVRVSNGAAVDTFTSPNTATTSLAATVAGDECVAFCWCNGTPAAAPAAGSFGSNSASLLQTFATNGSGLQDGTSSGGTINATMTTNGSGGIGYMIIAVALIPGATSSAPNDPLFFGCDF